MNGHMSHRDATKRAIKLATQASVAKLESMLMQTDEKMPASKMIKLYRSKEKAKRRAMSANAALLKLTQFAVKFDDCLDGDENDSMD